jgi:hypothetical protein
MSINTIRVISENDGGIWREGEEGLGYFWMAIPVLYENVEYEIIYQTDIDGENYALETTLECNQALMTALIESGDVDDVETAIAWIDDALDFIIDRYNG